MVTGAGTLGRLFSSELSATKSNWMCAKAQCENMGAQLVEILTDAQYTEVMALITKLNYLADKIQFFSLLL